VTVDSYGEVLAAQAEAVPDQPAITCGRTTLTWADLDRTSNAVGVRLLDLGIGKADVIAIGGPNRAELLVVAFGIWKIGATPFAIPQHKSAAEVDGLLALAKPALMVDVATGFNAVRTTVDQLTGASPDVPRLPPVVPPRLRLGASGGSTGRSKVIVMDVPAVVNRSRPWPPGMEPDGVHVVPLNLTDGTGFTMATQGLVTGSHVVIPESSSDLEILRLAAEHRATWMALTPPVMLSLWKVGAEARASVDLTSLSVCVTSGGVAPWLKEEWIDWLAPERVWELYGGTDARGTASIRGDDWLAHRGSVGRPDRGCEMTILDDAGSQLSPGSVGGIYIRDQTGKRNFHYLGAEITTLEDGWETLGDVGWMDEDGYVYLLDRAKDVITTAAGVVYPLEVEHALERHERVRSALVIGLPDAAGFEQVHALIDVPEGVVTEAELRRCVALDLATERQPASFEFVAGPLRDRAGKAQRSSMRAARLAVASPAD
jgi:bile acid-coenzyme A ligase